MGIVRPEGELRKNYPEWIQFNEWIQKQIARKQKEQALKILYDSQGKVGSENEEVIIMETKSRYQVILDLEEQRRDLLNEERDIDKRIMQKERNLKKAKDDLQEMEDDLNMMKANADGDKKAVRENIKSIEGTLARLDLSSSQKTK